MGPPEPPVESAGGLHIRSVFGERRGHTASGREGVWRIDVGLDDLLASRGCDGHTSAEVREAGSLEGNRWQITGARQ